MRIRNLAGQPKSLEEGDVLAELDHARDAEIVSVKDNTVTLKVDPHAADLPAGKTARAIYQPPGSKALAGTLPSTSWSQKPSLTRCASASSIVNLAIWDGPPACAGEAL